MSDAEVEFVLEILRRPNVAYFDAVTIVAFANLR
jgi:hypothetical protein